MDIIASDCKLKKCCLCIPVKFGVYFIGLMVSFSLLESLFTPLIPVQFFQDLVDYADANMKAYFYVKAGLELMLVMIYVQLLV